MKTTNQQGILSRVPLSFMGWLTAGSPVGIGIGFWLLMMMIGAMIEARLAIAAAAHLAAGLCGFSFIDLDTPMLLAEDPFTGGYEQRGGIYDVSGVKGGLGIEQK